MNIYINDTLHRVDPTFKLTAVPNLLALSHSDIALSVNQTIIHRDRWHAVELKDGDHIDAFTVVAGG